MADQLTKFAKDNNITEFEKLWAKTNSVGYPLSTSDGEKANSDFNRYKRYDLSSAPSAKQTTQVLATQGFATGSGLISSAAATELISPADIEQVVTNIATAFTSGKPAEAFKGLFMSGLDTLMDGALDIVQKEVLLRNQVNAKIGLSGELSRGYRDNILEASVAVVGMGYSFDELSQTAISATEETGRFFTLNEKTMMNMAETSRAFVGDLDKMSGIFRDFELVGIGAESALENINEAGKSSLSLGLNARKTTEMLNKDLGMINKYGFENGTQGLNRMVQKSIEFRMSMDSVFNLAEKVMSPEGAMDLAANLQVLGGAIGSLGDPLQMMYMATNDVGGLQDALIGAAESLATYNSEQGRFEITGANLRRARAMATELNMSYEELSKTAVAAAERTSAAADLMAQGISMDDKDQEFITNLAKMGPGGKMTIEVPPSIAEKLGVERQIALEDLDQRTADVLIENRKDLEKMDVRDLALNQFTETQQMALNINQISQMLKVEFAKTYQGMGSEMDKYVKMGNDLLSKYVTGQDASGEISKTVNEMKATATAKFNEEKQAAAKTQTTALQPTNTTTATPPQTTNQTTTPTTVTYKVEHTVNTTSSLVNEVGKAIMNDPTTFEDFKNRKETNSFFYQPNN